MQSDKGTPSDKLRAALVYLLTCESLPSDSEYEQISSTLQVTSQTLPRNIAGSQGEQGCSLSSHWSQCPTIGRQHCSETHLCMMWHCCLAHAQARALASWAACRRHGSTSAL